MQITNLNDNSYAFKANIHSPKLKFKQADFFVRIRGYGKNSEWADDVKLTADRASNIIRGKSKLEVVLQFISIGIAQANKKTKNPAKINHTGILRIAKGNWRHGSDWDLCESLCTPYNKNTIYKSYGTRLDETMEKPLNNSLGISLTVPVKENKEKYLRHGNRNGILKSLNIIYDIYDKFQKRYNYQTVQQSDLKRINNDIAKIRWILAHATPWERGSDAIGNTLVRSMYKSLGIKSYPLKKGISLDLEAYCTNLKDYKKNFTSYFEKEPHIIE